MAQPPVDPYHADKQARPSSPPTDENALLAIIREMREQRLNLKEENERAAKDRRSERRWKMLFQILFFGSPMLLGILYFLFFVNAAGIRLGPWSDVVGVVRIDGEISSSSLTSAKKVIPALDKAFANPNVKGVVLSIDSPGGSPMESEQIYTALASLKKKHPKPVVAVINNLGASAAYMIALHADKIYAGKYSLVGSVGAIIAPWDLHKAIANLDVSQRVYASGKLKSFLNPFTPVTPEADSKANELVKYVADVFLGELRATRGKLLQADVDYGTGEVWGGMEAKSIGLVDEIATLDDVVAMTWSLKMYDFGPAREGLGVLSSGFSSAAASMLDNWLVRQSLQVR